MSAVGPLRTCLLSSSMGSLQRNSWRCAYTKAGSQDGKAESHTSSNHSQGSSDSHRHTPGGSTLAAVLGAAGITLGGYVFYNKFWRDGHGKAILTPTVSARSSELPYYTTEEIAKHTNVKDGIWTTYKDDVYDITKFVESHPGGKRIMLAAGGAIDPYWNIYTIHRSNEVQEILLSMRIGKLQRSADEKVVELDDPYADEPNRHPGFIINGQNPFDAETAPEILGDVFYTPNEVFYIRNHLPVPNIQPDEYKLEVVIPGRENVKLSFEDVKTKFKTHTVSVTLQCAGNRRAEMGGHKKIFGAGAGHTAIGNATWTGVRLRDVLKHCGMDEEMTEQTLQHIQFEGWDMDMAGEAYGASIPIEKAMRNTGDVLLAFEMNGEPLPRDHGYPLRVIVPGVVGARSVKWLRKITASVEESALSWHQNDYKSSPPDATQETYDFKKAPPIYESPVQSAILEPKSGHNVDSDESSVTVKGYAYSGGGCGILRVDVSADGGKTWHTAELDDFKQKPYQSWTWTLWEIDLPMPDPVPEQGLRILCKATDTHHNVQPEDISSIWNVRGFLNNSWHRVVVDVNSVSDEEEAPPRYYHLAKVMMYALFANISKPECTILGHHLPRYGYA